jgi:flagellar basal-body rod protein FlgG
MMRALSTAGTGMVAQQMNLDVIANNLANVNTTGFKSQRAEFQDMVYQTLRASGAAAGGASTTPEAAMVGLGSRFSASAASFATGAFQNTGNPLDVAIAGDGFFQIEMPDGSTAYTRDGSFKVDANGLVVTSDGYPLVPNLTVPVGASRPTISPTGQVTVTIPGQEEPSELGTIELAVFPNPAGLTRIGQNLYRAGGASGTATAAEPGQQGAGTLQQSMVEASNVQIVEEMVRMITAQRAYEINSKAVQTADDMLGILNNLKR